MYTTTHIHCLLFAKGVFSPFDLEECTWGSMTSGQVGPLVVDTHYHKNVTGKQPKVSVGHMTLCFLM